MTARYAHSLPGRPVEEWQEIGEHLRGVAERCRDFSSAFGAAEWGYLAGIWHDLGKFSDRFQHYLSGDVRVDQHHAEMNGRVDHSTAGAQYAVSSLGVMGHPLAYAIAGHHAGLPDAIGTISSLAIRLRKEIDAWDSDGFNPGVGVEASVPSILQEAIRKRDAHACAFFIRMLYSCLVDADFLDTEAFMNPEAASVRTALDPDVVKRMDEVLSAYLDAFPKEDTEVSKARREVLHRCREASNLAPGLFTLTVPTGGGKTLSSLAFALRHAVAYGLRRVVFVVPFTSIIEQNADVYRYVFSELSEELGFDLVLEHHSNFDVENETIRSRLATENWDSPLIVTTAVQFYESLFANRSSRCRKLHRLAKSVIVLDEAQTLPVTHLKPCLAVLRELSTNYGSSIVLCTATQPAIAVREGFPIGLDEPREIISEPAALSLRLKRVQVTDFGHMLDEHLAARIGGHERCLCIVNTRGHARNLHALLNADEANIHLSARMCPAHRSSVLRDILHRLNDQRPCRVITTRLIEAGVDVDFPVVYRSMTGLDSLAQAAGRCNRNGRLNGLGQVFVFRSEHLSGERFVQETANAAYQVMASQDDPLSITAINKYFRLYYWDQQSRWDDRRIMDKMFLDPSSRDLPFHLNFKDINDSFRLIESTGRSVIVPWGNEGIELTERLRASPFPDRGIIRRLQRYTVSLTSTEWNLLRDGIEIVHERFTILTNPKLHYSETYGVLGAAATDTTLIY